jgi:tetratricopeptide (TPR) repeat protein
MSRQIGGHSPTYEMPPQDWRFSRHWMPSYPVHLDRRWALLAVMGLMLCGGCARFDIAPNWAGTRLRMDDISIAGVQGPEERRLRNRLQRDQQEATSEELAAEFQALEVAQASYDAGKYAEAEAQFAEIRERSSTNPRFAGGLFRRGLFNRHQHQDELNQSPIEEDAMFMLAQCQFQQGRLYDAEQSYAELLGQYPSTRHLDDVSRQLFRIAREWLGFPDEDDTELVQVAYSEESPPAIEERQEVRSSVLPNLRDETRPLYNAPGKGLDALRLIWLHDAAGPLADDALMMAANYHLKSGDPIEAAQHYRLLREQFPDSPHLKDSLMLGSHVLLVAYNGSGYDPSPLEEAKQLKLMSLQYPDLNPEDRARIEEELTRIADMEVEPLWKEVEFYMAKRQPESVLLHCNYIINTFPNSRYAKMAMEVREQITGKPSTARADDWTNYPTPAPVTEEEEVEVSPPQGPATAEAVDATATTPEPREPGRFRPNFERFLRRAEQTPELQSIDEAETTDEPAEMPAVEEPVAEEPVSGRVRL